MISVNDGVGVVESVLFYGSGCLVVVRLAPNRVTIVASTYPNWSLLIRQMLHVMRLRNGERTKWVLAGRAEGHVHLDESRSVLLQCHNDVRRIRLTSSRVWLMDLPDEWIGRPIECVYCESGGKPIDQPMALGHDLSRWLGSVDESPDGAGVTGYGPVVGSIS